MSQLSFHPLDEQLANLLQRLAAEDSAASDSLWHLVRYLSARTREGVIAVPLAELPNETQAGLQLSAVVGTEGEFKPLIVSHSHIWLYRYWLYEHRLAHNIAQRIPQEPLAATKHPEDLQQHAVELALQQNLLIISGGPGTGKTTTVTRILAHLLEQGVSSARIMLAAPTGKAAMRMQEAIRVTRQRLNLPAELDQAMPETASTLHRLLGYIPNRVSFRHHADNPLPADVVIVDEASMIDISLMTHLFEAVAPQAKLILLGDRDQLASVETGSIFRDLCVGAALAEQIVVLQKSYRFVLENSVGQLALAIREANAKRMLEVLDSVDYPEVDLVDLQAGLAASWLHEGWGAYLQALQQQAPHEEIFRCFEQLRLLTPLRQGPQGVEALNRWVDGIMQRHLKQRVRAGGWYVGKPVMVTQNDYRLNLFNGDIGITLADSDGQLRVCFPSETLGQYRMIAPVRLPEHETAWAMTIHKSQGSEFEQVLLLLPDMEDLSLLGRELLYTAVTRAKQGVKLVATQASLVRALQHSTPESSQLQQRLQALL